MLTASITGGAAAVKQALGQLASSFLQQLIPGPIGGAIGGLVNALFNMTKGDKLQTEVNNIVRTFPVDLTNTYASNPASANYGGRSFVTGAGVTVQIALQGDAGQMFNAYVHTAQRDQNELQGMSGVSSK